MPAKGLPSCRVGFQIVAQHSRTALSEAIDVNGHAQIIEFAMACDFSRLPDRTFGHFAIAQQNINAIALVLELVKVDRQTDARRNTLPEGSSSNIYEGKPWGGVSFQIGIDAPQSEQVFSREQTSFGPGRIKDRRRMSLGKHKDIVRWILGVLWVIAHDREKEHRHDLSGRGATGGMSAAGSRRGTDGINSQLVGLILQ